MKLSRCLIVLLATLAALRSWAEDPRHQSRDVGKLHEVSVRVEKSDAHGCVLTAPDDGKDPDFKVRVRQGESVQWYVTSNCDMEVEVRIDGFRPCTAWNTAEQRKMIPQTPLSDKEPLTAKATRVKPGKVTGTVRGDIDLGDRPGITWDYDISLVIKGKTVSTTDPEIEIPK